MSDIVWLQTSVRTDERAAVDEFAASIGARRSEALRVMIRYALEHPLAITAWEALTSGQPVNPRDRVNWWGPCYICGDPEDHGSTHDAPRPCPIGITQAQADQVRAAARA